MTVWYSDFKNWEKVLFKQQDDFIYTAYQPPTPPSSQDI